MATETTPPPDETPDERKEREDKAVVSEAKKRFKRCQDWESDARKLFLEDLKFANADADNGYQWPNQIRKNRDADERPCLTINKTRQHNLQIINDAKQNKPGIAIRGTGNGATNESAQALESLIRAIEYHSRASTAYDTATSFQVQGGIGYIRVATGYAGDQTFDQEIQIHRVADPLTIYLDPDAKEADKSDSRFAFIFENVPRDQFDLLYPQYKDLGAPSAALGAGDGDWVTQDHVRVCEYFRRSEKTSTLVAMTDPNGQQIVIKKDLIPPEFASAVDSPSTLFREVVETEIEYFFFVGDDIKERKVWPGRYIPIVPVIGEEVVIDGRLDRKGHTRAMKDAQRMYNYWTSSATEHVALQSKAPWIAPAAAIEEFEVYWENANKENSSVLPYNHVDDAGEPIPAPTRPQPPEMAPAYISGMQIASDELMAVSGQYQAQMGQQGNERTGVAIAERQRQGDNSTYHYIDNLAIAIRQVGRIVLDLIPHICDTKRVLMAMAEDGTDFQVEIDPQAQQAFAQQQDHNGQIAQRVLNPNIGKYDVEADIGPAYATKREEAFHAFTLLLSQNPELASLIGDIMLKAGDFPMADEAAARLKRMVPPQALGLGPTMKEQMLQQQLDQLKGLLGKTMEDLASERLKLKGKDQMRDIDSYEAETKRMAALAKLFPGVDPAGLKAIIEQLVQEALHTSLGPVLAASQPGLQAAAGPDQMNLPGMEPHNMPGVREGVGGALYMRDYSQSPYYRRVG